MDYLRCCYVHGASSKKKWSGSLSKNSKLKVRVFTCIDYGCKKVNCLKDQTYGIRATDNALELGVEACKEPTSIARFPILD